MRYALNKPSGQRDGYFTKPGLENGRNRYRAAKLNELIDWTTLDRVDASLRFGAHPIASDEDKLTEQQLSEALEALRGERGYEADWMSRGHYNQFPLRAYVEKRRYRLEPDANVTGARFTLKLLKPSSIKTWPYQPEWVERTFEPVERLPNDWLAWENEELMSAAAEAGIDAEDAMSIEIAVYRQDEADVQQDASFGFFVKTT